MAVALFSLGFGFLWLVVFRLVNRCKFSIVGRVGADLLLSLSFPFSHFAICLMLTDCAVKPYAWIFLGTGFILGLLVMPSRTNKRRDKKRLKNTAKAIKTETNTTDLSEIVLKNETSA